jgi:hypothetical protein
MATATETNHPPQQLKAALKAAGYNQRQVSVRNRPGGLSWSLVVTVRCSSVDIEKVKHVAGTFESIDRCEYSGEILGGGNIYVRVKEEIKN